MCFSFVHLFLIILVNSLQLYVEVHVVMARVVPRTHVPDVNRLHTGRPRVSAWHQPMQAVLIQVFIKY